MITSSEVQALFDYRDGKLFWRSKANKRHPQGAEAGTINTLGYRVITIEGKKIHAHRLVWLWHGKELPEQIDHINGDRADNRIQNLRAADSCTNAYNAKLKSDNTSGVKGVSWCKTAQRWVVQLYHRKQKVSGRFKEFADAVAFATAKRAELHGEFACSGVRT